MNFVFLGLRSQNFSPSEANSDVILNVPKLTLNIEPSMTRTKKRGLSDPNITPLKSPTISQSQGDNLYA